MKVRIGVGMGALSGDPDELGALVDDLDGLGFDSLWLPEVLTAPTLDPLAALAFAAARNPHLKLGTTMLLPRAQRGPGGQAAGHPRPAVGRTTAGHLRARPGPDARVGRGRRGPKEKGPRMEEAFPVLRRLLAGETVDHHGEVGDFDAVTLVPPAGAGPARVLDRRHAAGRPRSGAVATPTVGCRRRARRPRWPRAVT